MQAAAWSTHASKRESAEALITHNTDAVDGRVKLVRCYFIGYAVNTADSMMNTSQVLT